MAKPAWVDRWRQANIAPLYAAALIGFIAFVVGVGTLNNVPITPNHGGDGEILAPRMTPSAGSGHSYSDSPAAWLWFIRGSYTGDSQGSDIDAAPRPPDNEVLAVETQATTPEQPDEPAAVKPTETPTNTSEHAPQPTPTASAPAVVVQPTSTPAKTSHANTPDPTPTASPVPPTPTPTSSARDNFHVPTVSAGPMNNMEQRLFEGLNAERASAGMAPYTYDAGLSVVARTRSQQMVDQGYFAHRDPFGYSMYVELLAHFGYRYAWAGENLAMNNFANHESPERAVAALMNSPSHRANILSGSFSRVGVGLSIHSDGRKFYTMIFLSP